MFLFSALMHGDREMLLRLLHHGADVRNTQADGHLFSMRMSTYFGGSCLGLAIAQGQHQLVADLLSLPLGLRPNVNGIDLGPFLMTHRKPPSLIALAAMRIQAVRAYIYIYLFIYFFIDIYISIHIYLSLFIYISISIIHLYI